MKDSQKKYFNIIKLARLPCLYNTNHVRFQKDIHLSNDNNDKEGINVLMKKVFIPGLTLSDNAAAVNEECVCVVSKLNTRTFLYSHTLITNEKVVVRNLATGQMKNCASVLLPCFHT